MTKQKVKLPNNEKVSRETPASGGSRETLALKALGKRIENVRKLNGISIRSVSVSTGISEATISNFEKGKLNNIGFNNLVSICSLLNINTISF